MALFPFLRPYPLVQQPAACLTEGCFRWEDRRRKIAFVDGKSIECPNLPFSRLPLCNANWNTHQHDVLDNSGSVSPPSSSSPPPFFFAFAFIWRRRRGSRDAKLASLEPPSRPNGSHNNSALQYTPLNEALCSSRFGEETRTEEPLSTPTRRNPSFLIIKPFPLMAQ